MIRAWLLTVLGGLVLTSAASAQTAACRFRWQPGQVLIYKVEQITSASETVGDTKVDTSTRLSNVKRWQVLGVDAGGVATLQLSLQALRLETTTPNGDVLIFDSANLDQSHPQMREQLVKYVGQALAVIRVHPSGKVIEVKESKHGPASKFETEPPFSVTFPETEVKPGQGWERAYTIKTQPEAVADRVPLLQILPEGEVVFDLQLGCIRSARLQIEKELQNHQGEGSSYKFKSSYVEEYLGAR
jgi:hypothetical protein